MTRPPFSPQLRVFDCIFQTDRGHRVARNEYATDTGSGRSDDTLALQACAQCCVEVTPLYVVLDTCVQSSTQKGTHGLFDFAIHFFVLPCALVVSWASIAVELGLMLEQQVVANHELVRVDGILYC
jgi:hypothetical protein